MAGCKGSSIHTRNRKQKEEFAKDVSALANAAGGPILIGFDTERHPTTAAEQISKVCLFPLDMATPDRYLKILRPPVHPPLQVKVLHFESSDEKGKGVAAIVVTPSGDRPHLVGQVLDENDRSLGVYFGYF